MVISLPLSSPGCAWYKFNSIIHKCACPSGNGVCGPAYQENPNLSTCTLQHEGKPAFQKRLRKGQSLSEPISPSVECVHLGDRIHINGKLALVECPDCPRVLGRINQKALRICSHPNNPTHQCVENGSPKDTWICSNCNFKVAKAYGSIPKVFHRVWLGPKKMPEEFVNYGKTWIALHPDWEMWIWTYENIYPLRVEECKAWAQCESFSQQSDVIRYHALLMYGGVYLDTDVKCQKNIDGLLKGHPFVCAKEDARFVGSAFIGSVAGHPIIKRAVEIMNAGIDPGKPVSQLGPMAITTAIGDYPAKIYPAEMFYPYHWTETHRRSEEFPNAYAVHYWDHSWGK